MSSSSSAAHDCACALPATARRSCSCTAGRSSLALIVVILGGTGSLLGALVGSFLIGFLYNFGQAMFPDLAYVILFLPMLVILVLRPQGLFGKVVS